MKLFKKSILSICALAALVSVQSCNYVDIEPEATVKEEGVDYTNISEMYSPVVGAYSQLRSSGMHWANAMVWFGRDGDMWSGRRDDQGDAVAFGHKGGYNYANGFWALNNAWVTMYEIIRTCNSALDALNEYAAHITNDADRAKYNQYCGEVRVIRAWAYYQMASTFGHCVILYNNQQVSFNRSKVEKVYQYIIDEMTDAAKYMEAKRPNQMDHKGAYTKYTAETILAQAAMMLGQYEVAENATNDIMEHGHFSLYQDYWNLWKIPGKLCDESIMEVQVTDFGNPTGDYIGIDQYFNFRGAGISPLPGTTGAGFGGWTFMRYDYDFVTWAKNRGETVRRYASFLEADTEILNNSGRGTGWKVNPGMTEGMPTVYDGKAYLPYEQMTNGAANRDYGRNNNCRLLRYAEVLLINAEAKVRQNKSAGTGFKLVRERAGFHDDLAATVDNILDERRMELCSEYGSRYNDLVRTGKAAQVLGKFGWTAEKTYWPVPGAQLTNVPSLANDPE